MRHFNKHFADWLIRTESGHVIIKGTEDLPRHPNYKTLAHVKGIIENGTGKINGVTCMKVANDQAEPLKRLGWRLVDRKTYYSYVLPPEGK